MDQAGLAEKPALRLERFYPVGPEKVWRAWTDPQALKRWFGPGGVQPVALAELDVRAGGRFRVLFGGARGDEHEVRGVYREVVPNRRLVFTWTWPRTTPERESLVTIELRPAGRGTELVFLHERHVDETVRDNHRRGWSESFAKLERFLLEERPSLVLTRVYPVPVERVWRAWIDPQALRVWWNQVGAPDWRAELDLRVGGRCRFVLRDAQGATLDFRGVYREVEAPRRLVLTWNLHGCAPEHESLVTVALTPHVGGTELLFRQDPVFDARAHEAWHRDFNRLADYFKGEAQ